MIAVYILLGVAGVVLGYLYSLKSGTVGLVILCALPVASVALKLTGLINWGWVYVLLPLSMVIGAIPILFLWWLSYDIGKNPEKFANEFVKGLTEGIGEAIAKGLVEGLKESSKKGK